jgi:hypothetical protein
MKWFLVFWAFQPAVGGDPGIVAGYIPPHMEVKIEMPSLEVCQQVKDTNKTIHAECWTKD